MPGIPTDWPELLAELVQALKNAYAHRNDPKFWDAQIEKGSNPGSATKSNATVESVSLEATGFTIKVKDANGERTEWHASPGKNGHPIKFNGEVHDEASVVLRPTPSPINPVRFHLDIRWVQKGGEVIRLDTEFPRNS
jgi:hypothetical protein